MKLQTQSCVSNCSLVVRNASEHIYLTHFVTLAQALPPYTYLLHTHSMKIACVVYIWTCATLMVQWGVRNCLNYSNFTDHRANNMTTTYICEKYVHTLYVQTTIRVTCMNTYIVHIHHKTTLSRKLLYYCKRFTSY